MVLRFILSKRYGRIDSSTPNARRNQRNDRKSSVVAQEVKREDKQVLCDRSQARRQAGVMCYEIEDEHAHITYHRHCEEL